MLIVYWIIYLIAVCFMRVKIFKYSVYQINYWQSSTCMKIIRRTCNKEKVMRNLSAFSNKFM